MKSPPRRPYVRNRVRFRDLLYPCRYVAGARGLDGEGFAWADSQKVDYPVQILAAAGEGAPRLYNGDPVALFL